MTGSGIVGNKTIRIFDSNVTFGVLQARSIGELTAADPMKLSGETTTRMIIEGQPTGAPIPPSMATSTNYRSR